MDHQTLKRLLRNLKSQDADMQHAALKELVHTSATEAAPTILLLLKSPDVSLRCAAASALGRLGRYHLSSVGPALTAHLEDDDALVRSEIIDALAALGYSESVAVLRGKLRDPDALVRASAAEALGDLDDASALQDLVVAFTDSDEAVRVFAVRAYGLIAPSHQTRVLIEHSKFEKSSFVQAELVAAYCRLDITGSLDQVLETLERADEDLAVQILNTIEDLLVRRTPSAAERESARIRSVLEETARRFPLLRGQAQEMIARIDRRTP